MINWRIFHTENDNNLAYTHFQGSRSILFQSKDIKRIYDVSKLKNKHQDLIRIFRVISVSNWKVTRESISNDEMCQQLVYHNQLTYKSFFRYKFKHYQKIDFDLVCYLGLKIKEKAFLKALVLRCGYLRIPNRRISIKTLPKEFLQILGDQGFQDCDFEIVKKKLLLKKYLDIYWRNIKGEYHRFAYLRLKNHEKREILFEEIFTGPMTFSDDNLKKYLWKVLEENEQAAINNDGDEESKIQINFRNLYFLKIKQDLTTDYCKRSFKKQMKRIWEDMRAVAKLPEDIFEDILRKYEDNNLVHDYSPQIRNEDSTDEQGEYKAIAHKLIELIKSDLISTILNDSNIARTWFDFIYDEFEDKNLKLYLKKEANKATLISFFRQRKTKSEFIKVLREYIIHD